jgi:ankyrin repeat protein
MSDDTDEPAPPENEKFSLALDGAAKVNDIDAAKRAIAEGADVHYGRDMALRSAAKAGHVGMLVYLIQGAGADIHAVNDEALRHAVKNNREGVVKALLDFGANADVMEGEPLIQAATKGFSDVAASLLAHGANPHFSDDQALRQAAYNGHLAIVQELAENKADLFAVHGSAAVLAANENHESVVSFLAERMERERKAFVEALSGSPASSFLRTPYRDTGEVGFVRAVKMNCLEETVARMKACGDTLTGEELHGIKDRHGHSLAILAADCGKLSRLFDPDLWPVTLDAVKAAWEQIPPAARKSGGMGDEEFGSVIAALNQRALREKSGKLKLKL